MPTNGTLKQVEASKASAKILIVDDEPIVRELLCLTLRSEGFELIEAETGEQAVQLIDSTPDIDLVLLDISMPGLDGFDVLSHIRRHPRLNDSGVIIITSGTESEQAIRAFKDGANDYITKPVDIDIARIRIKNQLNLKLSKENLVESRRRYDLAASGANDGLWDWDLQSGEFYVSERWKELLGIKIDQLVESPNAWLDRIHKSDREAFDADLTNYLNECNQGFENEHRITLDDGSVRWVLCRGMAMRGDDGAARQIAGWLTDITNSKLIDKLTGLSNRTYFLDRANQCIDRLSRNPDFGFAILFIDIDNFKLINDSHGHEVGDNYLKIIADRLRACLRKQGSVVARFGGDEFAIVIEDIYNINPSIKICERILDKVSEPIRIADQTIFPGISIGISYTKDANAKAEDLLREADTAMYQVKSSGKGGFEIFNPSMQRKVKDRLRIENEIRDGLDLGEFTVFYQPIIDMAERKLVAYEVLLRWNHPEKGLIGPGYFIDVAEETSLINPLGQFAMEEACRQTVEFKHRSSAFDGVRCNINASPNQLMRPQFADTLNSMIQNTELQPEDLNLEITENSLFDSRANAKELLASIRESGIKITIDDFGTGTSSLACLHELPLDMIKVDRAFVDQMLNNKRSESIVRAIVMLAKGLSLEIIAEGVETEAQHQFLRDLECNYSQGYLYAHPMPAEDLFQFANDLYLS